MTPVKLRIDFYKWQAGDVAELKDHSAAAFIQLGWAVPVKVEAKKVEKELKKAKR